MTEIEAKTLTIANPLVAFSADPQALGGAFRALIAGGSSLGDRGIKQASGLTEYVWTRKGREVLDIVRAMEGKAARK